MGYESGVYEHPMYKCKVLVSEKSMFGLFIVSLVCAVGVTRGECVPPIRPTDLSLIDTDLLQSLDVVHNAARGRWVVFSAHVDAYPTAAALQEKFPNTTVYLNDTSEYVAGGLANFVARTCNTRLANDTTIVVDGLYVTEQIMDMLTAVSPSEPMAVAVIVYNPLVLSDIVRSGLFFEIVRGAYAWLDDST